MGALKNLCHDELEAKRYASEEFPELAWLFGRFAETIATDLCASDRAKGEHFVIAANLLPIVADEFERWTNERSSADARLSVQPPIR